MEYQYFTLGNGIRIIHKAADSEVAHCGVVINAGSRDEKPDENGLAHFIEHVIFKGTKKRKAFHVLSRLENVGGDLNAYTGKEETFIYASFLNKYYSRTLELFADILFASVFPEKELKKEKEVVLDEINSYKDTPSELIFDEFEELLFHGHPIGHCILGKPDSVRNLRKENIHDFLRRYYQPENMVICSVGKIDFKKLIKLSENYFSNVPSNKASNERFPFNFYKAQKEETTKMTHQVHCITGNLAYDVRHEKKIRLSLLTNILGGPGMNSRLNLGIREKYGYCYNLEANYQPYSDTGIFNIYFGTDNGYLEKSLYLVFKELNKLRNQKLGTLQLHRAKQQIIGQLAISLESNLNEMLSIGKSHLVFEKVDTINDINDKIVKITSEDLLDVANEVFDPDQFSTLIYL